MAFTCVAMVLIPLVPLDKDVKEGIARIEAGEAKEGAELLTVPQSEGPGEGGPP
jgi:hypothetical protein